MKYRHKNTRQPVRLAVLGCIFLWGGAGCVSGPAPQPDVPVAEQTGAVSASDSKALEGPVHPLVRPLLEEEKNSLGGKKMDREALDRIVREEGKEVQQEEGVWQFRYQGVPMLCVMDAEADRMRFVSPIMPQRDMTPEQLLNIMDANFHTALDARYATSRGILFAAFVHPLSTLAPRDVRSAISQVAHLVITFGTTYSSGVFAFGEEEKEGEPKMPAVDPNRPSL